MRSIRVKEAVTNRGWNADLLMGNNSFNNDTPFEVIPSIMVTPDQSPFKGGNRPESGPLIVQTTPKQIIFAESHSEKVVEKITQGKIKSEIKSKPAKPQQKR